MLRAYIKHEYTDKEVECLSNQLVAMISEYLLMCSAHPGNLVSPVVPKELERRLRPLTEYLTRVRGIETSDLRLRERAHTMQVAVYLHCIEANYEEGEVGNNSLVEAHHHQGPLLDFFLAITNGAVTFEEVITQVLRENEEYALEEVAEAEERLTKHKARRHAARCTYKKACEALKTTQRRHTSNNEIQEKDKALDKYQKWRDRVGGAKWSKMYAQAYLDRRSLDELQGVKDTPNPTDSEPEPETESSESSSTSESSSSDAMRSEESQPQHDQEEGEGDGMEVDNVEAEEAADEATDEEGDAEEPLRQGRPLSPTNNTDDRHLDSTPSAMPSHITVALPDLHVASPHP